MMIVFVNRMLPNSFFIFLILSHSIFSRFYIIHEILFLSYLPYFSISLIIIG